MPTTLVLSNKQMVGLASMDACIAAIENAYTELGQGQAKELPRRRIYQPRNEPPDHYYWFNEMAGIVPGIRSMGLRVNSATVNVTTKRGNPRLGFPGAFSALVFLFDTESTELIAVLQDYFINPIRVAATSAIVTRRLARPGAKTMGLFGTGTQALLQAKCNLAVTEIEEIRLYSTRPERRQAVAEKMTQQLGVRTIAVEHPREAVEG